MRYVKTTATICLSTVLLSCCNDTVSSDEGEIGDAGEGTENGGDTESDSAPYQQGFLPGWCRLSCDKNADGYEDYYTVTYYPKTGGRWTQEYWDEDPNTGEITSVTFDKMGRVQCRKGGIPGDNYVEYCTVCSYNEIGCIEECTSTQSDGIDTVLDHSALSYHECILADEEIVQIEQLDYSADGTIDLIEERKYNLFQDPISIIQKEVGGQVEYSAFFEYDGNRNLIGQTFDVDGNGTIDNRTTATYTADNRQITIRSDDDADGRTDWALEWIFDQSGWAIRQEFTQIINDQERTTVSINVLSYDVSGNPLDIEIDTNEDGTIDAKCIASYKCW